MINIVTALPCEARPVLEYYDLAPMHEGGRFQICGSDHCTLIISGIGKLSVATACGYLAGLQPPNHGAWLNLGIAGHRDHALGDGFLANRITDADNNRDYYPAMIFDQPCASEHLITVSKAENDYARAALYDMEAAGFFAAATRFSPLELVHSYKVVSDNAASPADRVSPGQVEALLQSRMPEVARLVELLAGISSGHSAIYRMPDAYQLLADRHHFTVTEKNELQQLLRRWTVLSEQQALPGDIANADSAVRGNDILQRLQHHLRQLPAAL